MTTERDVNLYMEHNEGKWRAKHFVPGQFRVTTKTTRKELHEMAEEYYVQGMAAENVIQSQADTIENLQAKIKSLTVELKDTNDDKQDLIETVSKLHEASKALLAVMAGAECYHDPDL